MEEDFEDRSLTDIQLERISKEITPELENIAKTKPQTYLSKNE